MGRRIRISLADVIALFRDPRFLAMLVISVAVHVALIWLIATVAPLPDEGEVSFQLRWPWADPAEPPEGARLGIGVIEEPLDVEPTPAPAGDPPHGDPPPVP